MVSRRRKKKKRLRRDARDAKLAFPEDMPN